MSDFMYYEVLQNRDMTEGRGPMVAVNQFITLEKAVEDAKGRGVMGHGDGQVDMVSVTLMPNDGVRLDRVEVYGYRRNSDGTWGYGYKDVPGSYFTISKDPDYAEYLRLKSKFEEKN